MSKVQISHLIGRLFVLEIRTLQRRHELALNHLDSLGHIIHGLWEAIFDKIVLHRIDNLNFILGAPIIVFYTIKVLLNELAFAAGGMVQVAFVLIVGLNLAHDKVVEWVELSH